ncbi:MAG: amino acid adenylation domain-containing protein, partial [Chitinophagaceae bacterium]|nr:amino acid adenylation domain-containing protein [Chitinophagaceae bacterium]
QQNISLFNLLLLAFSIFMSKLFNQRTILLNYPVNIRTDKSISGCFVNTVTFSTTLEEKDSYLSLIQAWPDRMNALKQVAKSTASQQLHISTIPSFAYSYFATPHELVIENKSYFSESHAQIARSNLAIKYREQNGKLFFKCELLSHIFPQHFAKSLLPRFFHYLDKIVSAPSSPLFAIDLTFPEERKKILFDFNDTDSPYPEDKTLIDLFDAIVSQYPNKTAVKAFNGNLTYSELNQKAEHLASFLIQEGIRPDDTVAILIDNRVEMIIAIMAVLKAGGAYLPLTDNSPIDNIIYYIKDSNTKCVLTIPALAEKINLPIPIINITEVPPSFNQNYIKPPLKISNLAYIIYTSGTTGKPKGILVEHRTVVIYVNYLIKSNQLDSDSVGSKYADFSFDASVIEIYPILLSGGTLCILKDKDRLDHIEVNNFINENKITYSFLPTQFAELFFQLKNSQLSTLIVGGDKLNSFIQNSYRTINAYGPTEATVQSTSFLVDKLYENIPIGKPIDNVKCYVVDRQLNLIPPGMIGELLIGGKCLARGYLNNRELTDKKFIFNPFQTEEEKIDNKNLRLYKTGDLARWLPDGNLEYIGRYDSQVKIRGYRIELAEIESKLITHSKIKQAVVLAKEYSTHSADSIDKYLVAYYVADNKLNDSDIHNYLSKQLPEYMIPA